MRTFTRQQVKREGPASSALTRSVAPLADAAKRARAIPHDAAPSRFAHDFTSRPVYAGPPPSVQTKPVVGAPGDAYEQEADRVSAEVMSMSAHVSGVSAPRGLQRACACGGGCAGCQTKTPDEERVRLQTKSDGPPAAAATAVPPVVHEALRAPGQPLDAATRAFMEPRFGRDFGGVRVHTGAKAAESARAVNALAYTVGPDVVLGAGAPAPSTGAGRRLLAHELTHVVQQTGAAAAPRLQRAPAPEPAEGGATGAATGTAAAGATCVWSSLDDAKKAIDILLAALMSKSGALKAVSGSPVVAVDEAGEAASLQELYLGLKKARVCFPAFVEGDFVAMSASSKILSDKLRTNISGGRAAKVAGDDRKLIWAESREAFAGYSLSGFEADDRFTNPAQSQRLGYTLTGGHKTATEFAGSGGRDAKGAFEVADILVFSGHQYAQYQAPGVWADNKNNGWDLRKVQGPLTKVKLLISTSCATLCREAAAVWKPLFPNAVLLGYKKSAPIEGGPVANAFAAKLPQDLILDSGGVQSAVSAWKATVAARHKGDGSVQPGWLRVGSGDMEYWNGRSWVADKADSEKNKCYVKGDYTASWPDPRRPAATP